MPLDANGHRARRSAIRRRLFGFHGPTTADHPRLFSHPPTPVAEYPAQLPRTRPAWTPTGLRRSEDCFVDKLFDRSAIACGCAAHRRDVRPRLLRPQSREVGARSGDVRRRPTRLGQHHQRPGWRRARDTSRAWSRRANRSIGGNCRSGEAEFRVEDLLGALPRRTLRRLLDETKRSFRRLSAGRLPLHARPGPIRRVVASPRHRPWVTRMAPPASPGIMRCSRTASSTELGFRVRRNDPYAGGYVTRHYGRPRDRVHALQIELARGLYMDEAKLARTPEFTTVQQRLGRFAASLSANALDLLGREDRRT